MASSTQQMNISRVGPTLNGVAPEDLREAVDETLERLSQLLLTHPSRNGLGATSRNGPAGPDGIQDTVKFLGQVVAAWPDVPAGALPPAGAGFGSTVDVEDIDQKERETFTLMAGTLLDIDAGQVSLASPIGQALLGAKKGDIVHVQLPQRVRRFRVKSVHTLRDKLAEHHTLPAA